MRTVRELRRRWRRIERRHRDDGAVLPLVLLLIIVGALIVIPVMGYSIAVMRANNVEADRIREGEAAKAGIRVALDNPSDLFLDCDNATNKPVDGDPDIGGYSVSVNCSEVTDLGANEYFGFASPLGAAVMQIGPTPANAGDFVGLDDTSGVLASSGIAPPYPADATGGAPAWAWWKNWAWVNPLDTDDIRVIWQPPLPTVTAVDRDAAPYQMDSAYDCDVFLPGRYDDPITLSNAGSTTANYYFASGRYYFSQPITIEGNVRVVVGQGLADFGVANACADDIQVAYNLQSPPDKFSIDGGGATWVFGDQARLVVDEIGGHAPSVIFNQRYAEAGGGGWISIMSVNGDYSYEHGGPADDDEFESGDGDHLVTNVNYVERSQVLEGDVYSTDDLVPLGEPTTAYLTPSNRTLTDEARVPGQPVNVSVSAYSHEAGPDDGALLITLDGVEGHSTNGALINAYEASVQGGGTTTTCSTDTTAPFLMVPTIENSVGEDQANPDRYSCLVTGLPMGQSYTVEVRAASQVGVGSWASAGSVSIPADPAAVPLPAAPTGVVAEQSPSGDALISWDPTTGTAAPITSYNVDVYRVYQVDCDVTIEDWDTDCNSICDTYEICNVGCAYGDDVCNATTCEPWDSNCNIVCDLGEVCNVGCLYDDAACNATDCETWDANCNVTCDVSEDCNIGCAYDDDACNAATCQVWDLDCSFTCDTGEACNLGCDYVDLACNAAICQAWDSNCNIQCDALETCNAGCDYFDATCNSTTCEAWDSNCNIQCDALETCNVGCSYADDSCNTTSCESWDTNCNIVCDATEDCNAGCAYSDPICNGIDCELWDTDCDITCDSGEACNSGCEYDDDACNSTTCEAWDTNCNIVCDSTEACNTGCDYDDDACNTTPVCESWDKDCDGVCDTRNGNGDRDWDWDRDCDGRCDSNENCSDMCAWSEPWDANCDATCDAGETCNPTCDYHDDACQLTEYCEGWELTPCTHICVPGQELDLNCDGRCRGSDGENPCGQKDFSEPWDNNKDGDCDDWGGPWSQEECHIDCEYHDDACNTACAGTANWWDCPAAGGGFATPAARGEIPSYSQSYLMAPPSYQEEVKVDGFGCTSEPRTEQVPADEGFEWTPALTECLIAGLPDLPASQDGHANVGYRFDVTAITPAGSSAVGSVQAGLSVSGFAAGTPSVTSIDRIVYPWVPTPIIEVNASGNSAQTVLEIPGYVAVPMGRISISNDDGDDVRLYGGVLTGTLDVADDPRVPIPHGYQEDVILQRTVRLEATVEGTTSVAIVKINADGDSYGIVSWITQ